MASPTAPRPLHVLFVGAHVAVREALAGAFAGNGAFALPRQAGSLAEARALLGGTDVAVVDLALAGRSGLEVITELRAANPAAHALVLSAGLDRLAIARAVEKGAACVLDKATSLDDVIAAVRRLHAGETLIPLEEMVELLRLAGQTREREIEERELGEGLTPREREVLQLLADGLDSHQIAARLHISPRTERNHVASILAKLRVHSQLQAVVFALRRGIVAIARDGG